MTLPIDNRLPDIVAALRAANRVVVHAPPGSGKTTRTPAAIVDALGAPGAVVVLEPRRIAARAAADFVARERGGRVGQEVGYQVRFERHGGAATRLWYVTEGILSRRLVRDPFLEGVSVVVLDEFHERHLHGDLALALVCELQRTVRPDLGLVVMSATLEADRVAAHLGGCPVIRVDVRPHPVVIRHLAASRALPLAARVREGVAYALAAESQGDILVFLPGVGEIRRGSQELAALAQSEGIEVVSLHGNLPLEQQRAVLRRGSRRRIVLATNVAETALTIDGVTAVVDSGLARAARYDGRHGYNTLQLVRVSRASAAQRAGRAGRTAPGTCWRLWSQAEHGERLENDLPEIRRLDLADLLLQVHAWGLAQPDQLPWLDPPPATACERAETLLGQLGAVDATGRLTAIGTQMVGLGTTPRLARMLVESLACGAGAGGALVAALAGERDIRRAHRVAAAALPEVRQSTQVVARSEPLAHAGSDLIECAELFLQAWHGNFERRVCAELDLDQATLHAVDRARSAFARALGVSDAIPRAIDVEPLGRSVLAGFPDRVCRRREVGSLRGVMVGGAGVVLDPRSAAAGAELFVALDAEGGRRRVRSEVHVRSASAVRAAWLEAVAPGLLVEEECLEFDSDREGVVARRARRYLDLRLRESVSVPAVSDAVGEVLAIAALAHPGAALALGVSEERLLARVGFAARAMPEDVWPSPDELLAAVVRRASGTRRSFAELRRVALLPELQRTLGHLRLGRLERELPEAYVLPSGRRAAIQYSGERAPIVEARVQELFGLVRTPLLARGRVALGFEILAPNQRPVQITRDLESFWRSGYPEVRKQLRGRYPKHDWPEDPWHAKPSSRARPRD